MKLFDDELDNQRLFHSTVAHLISQDIPEDEAYELTQKAMDALPLRLKSFEAYLLDLGYSQETVDYMKTFDAEEEGKAEEENPFTINLPRIEGATDEVHYDTLETVEDQPF